MTLNNIISFSEKLHSFFLDNNIVDNSGSIFLSEKTKMNIVCDFIYANLLSIDDNNTLKEITSLFSTAFNFSSSSFYSGNISVLPAEFNGSVHIGFNTAVLAEIIPDIFLRLFSGYMKVFRQTESAHTIYYSEIHGLCIASLNRGYLILRHFKHLGGGCGMNVDSFVE